MEKHVSCLSAGIIFSGVGLIQQEKLSNARNVYDGLGRKNYISKFDEAWANVKNKKKSRNASIAMSMLFLSGFAISIPF